MRLSMLFVGLLGLSACAFEGGANQNQKTAGNESGGVAIDTGDIGVAATGDYLVISASPGLRILRPTLPDHPLSVGMTLQRKVGVPVTGAKRLAFSPSREIFYVATLTSLVSIDAISGKVVWTAPLPAVVPPKDAYNEEGKPRLEVSKDDRYVLWSQGRTFAVFDSSNGAVRVNVTADDAILDFDVLPGNRAVITPTHHINNPHTKTATPETILSVVDLQSGATRNVSVPNCSSPLTVTSDGGRAFLAPTVCGRDPVSVIDLEEPKFNRNLPGFGPVALAPDGTVVAFMPDGEAYDLMVIDADTLDFRTTPVGPYLPRFAITPDGKVLLVDTTELGRDQVTLVDTHTLEHRTVAGPAMYLSNFVMTPDSQWAFAIDRDELWSLDIIGAKATHLTTAGTGPSMVTGSRTWAHTAAPAFIPQNINISPDGKTLYLRPRAQSGVGSAPTLCVYPIAQHACTEWLALE